MPAANLKILFANGDQEFLKNMSTKLEKKFSCKIVGVPSSSEAVKYIKANKDITLVISDFVFSDGTGELLYGELRTQKSTAPVIWVTDKTLNGIKSNKGLENFEKDNPFNLHLEKKMANDMLESKVSFVISGGKDVGISQKQEDYSSLFLGRMPSLQDFKFNYYVRLPSGKFILYIDKDDPAILDKIAKMQIEKGQGHVQLIKKDYQEFSENLLKMLHASLSNKDLAWEDLLLAQKQSMGFIHDYIRNRGFTSEIVLFTQKFVGHIQSTVSKCESLLGVIDYIREKNDYVVELALIQSYIAGTLALELPGDITANLKKLALAAICQDLIITHHPNMAIVEDLNGEACKALKDDEKLLVKRHAEMVAMLLSKVEGIAPEIIELLKNHHEKADGMGFPQGLAPQNMSQLTAIMIFAKDIAYCLCSTPEMITKSMFSEMLTSLKAKYDREPFAEIYQTYTNSILPALIQQN